MSRNSVGFRVETVAAEYETDAALAEYGSGLLGEFPPDDHYFWAAFRAEEALRTEDYAWIASHSATTTATGSSTTSASGSRETAT